jgi:hypothetical protein
MPSNDSTVRIVCTNYFWTGNEMKINANYARALDTDDIHSPYPGVSSAFMMGSFTASIENTLSNAGSRWDSAVMTAVHVRAL